VSGRSLTARGVRAFAPGAGPPKKCHHQEWIAACQTGRPGTCNFQYAGPLNEALLLGNVAHRVGRKLQWDPARLKAANCPEAEKYIQHQYRQGCTI